MSSDKRLFGMPDFADGQGSKDKLKRNGEVVRSIKPHRERSKLMLTLPSRGFRESSNLIEAGETSAIEKPCGKALRSKRKSLPARSKVKRRGIKLPNMSKLSREGRVLEELAAQRTKGRLLRRRHRAALRSELARVYHIAEFYKTSLDDWLDFCRAPEWDNYRFSPKPADQSNPLKYVLRFHVGLRGKNDNKRVSLFHRALSPLFEQGIRARKIPRLIKNSGGLERLASKHAEEVKAAKAINETPSVVVSLAEVESGLAGDLTAIPDGMIITATIAVQRESSESLVLSIVSIVSEGDGDGNTL